MAMKQCFLLLGLLVLLLPIYPHTAYPAARSMEAGPDPDSDREGFIWPVRGSVISRFGSRRFAGWHHGVDIKAPPGTPIRAAAPGTVTFSGRQSSYGRTIKIAHANGLSTVYAHNSANFVKAGDPVKAGTPIGAVGRTGRATTNHVHFEIRSKGVAKNPLPLLQRSQPGPMPAKPHEARAAAHHQPSSEIKG
jgi:murein DD-endopeptidase MepM/ murein hydrolase activator NlpD